MSFAVLNATIIRSYFHVFVLISLFQSDVAAMHPYDEYSYMPQSPSYQDSMPDGMILPEEGYGYGDHCDPDDSYNCRYFLHYSGFFFFILVIFNAFVNGK